MVFGRCLKSRGNRMFEPSAWTLSQSCQSSSSSLDPPGLNSAAHEWLSLPNNTGKFWPSRLLHPSFAERRWQIYPVFGFWLFCFNTCWFSERNIMLRINLVLKCHDPSAFELVKRLSPCTFSGRTYSLPSEYRFQFNSIVHIWPDRSNFCWQ